MYREYEDVFGREEVIAKSPLSKKDIGILFDSFMSICQWTPIYYLWRPNLRDEGDNHLIELAIAGNANVIVMNNVKDFRNSELVFEDICILTPFEWLKEKQS